MKERHIETVITDSNPRDSGLTKFGITPSGGLAMGVSGGISIAGGIFSEVKRSNDHEQRLIRMMNTWKAFVYERSEEITKLRV